MPPPPIEFTPPGRTRPQPGESVRRRHVFYLPGYDPEASQRYRTLFVREFTRYARCFAIGREAVSPVSTAPDGLSQSWTVEVETPEWSTTTVYEVLLWDDLVRGDIRRPLAASMVRFVGVMAGMVADGSLSRVYRLNVLSGHVLIYPFLVSALLALGFVLVAAAAGWAIDRAAAPPAWATVAAGIAAGAAAVALVAPRLGRYFAWQLLHNWTFNRRHAAGRRPDYEARLDKFARRVAARAREVGADEVMLVGHSTGGMTAIEVAARVLARDPILGDERRPVALVTLGSVMPLVAVQPAAHGLRAAIADLAGDPRVAWIDYQARQDWLNFPGFQPLRDLSLPHVPERALNPFVRSARYRDIVHPDIYRRIRRRLFRLHFQFLMANDLPGAYDYFALTLGPQRLLDRLWRPLIVQARPAN